MKFFLLTLMVLSVSCQQGREAVSEEKFVDNELCSIERTYLYGLYQLKNPTDGKTTKIAVELELEGEKVTGARTRQHGSPDIEDVTLRYQGITDGMLPGKYHIFKGGIIEEIPEGYLMNIKSLIDKSRPTQDEINNDADKQRLEKFEKAASRLTDIVAELESMNTATAEAKAKTEELLEAKKQFYAVQREFLKTKYGHPHWLVDGRDQSGNHEIRFYITRRSSAEQTRNLLDIWGLYVSYRDRNNKQQRMFYNPFDGVGSVIGDMSEETIRREYFPTVARPECSSSSGSGK